MAIHGRGFPIRPHLGRPVLEAAPAETASRARFMPLMGVSCFLLAAVCGWMLNG